MANYDIHLAFYITKTLDGGRFKTHIA